MSVTNVRGFFNKVEGDNGLQSKLKALAKNRNIQEAVADLVKLGEASGFKFTIADYTEARKKVAEELSKKKLSETEIEAVTAGVPGCPCGYKCGLLIRF